MNNLEETLGTEHDTQILLGYDGDKFGNSLNILITGSLIWALRENLGYDFRFAPK